MDNYSERKKTLEAERHKLQEQLVRLDELSRKADRIYASEKLLIERLRQMEIYLN